MPCRRLHTDDAYKPNGRQAPALIRLANIERALVERFYERIFHKNAKAFLLEFLMVRIWVIADCKPDRDFRAVEHRTSPNPDSGIVRRSSRSLRGFQECRRPFRYRKECKTSPI